MGIGTYRKAARSRRTPAAALLGAFALALACEAPPPAGPPPPVPPAPLPEVAPPPVPPCERIVQVDVFKADRRLVAHCEGGAAVDLTVALGREPEGPKRSAGDHRTPEGLYHVSGAPRPSRFHGFLPIDYPSMADAEHAWAEGRIGPADAKRILRAHEQGLHPPSDTPLGGHIGFHGEGERWRGDSPYLDWTYGCIALSDADFDFLTERVEPGVPVLILP